MSEFKLLSEFKPRGDQPKAIDELVNAINSKRKDMVLLGVTGSGKTFTMANIIARTGRPSLILAHNKTLAAQLYSEFKTLFPENAVEFFVSYYDYYQPEAYIPETNTYIEKDAAINDEIDRYRHSATMSLLSRRDVIVIASVSCIYGLGSPNLYKKMLITITKGQRIERNDFLRKLVESQYLRNDYDFTRGHFRVRGDFVEVFPAMETKSAYRVEFWGNEIERILRFDPLSGRSDIEVSELTLYPSSHYVTPHEELGRAIYDIETELKECVQKFKKEGKDLEAERLYSRTSYDLEMLREMGYCSGIENYSRHLSGRKKGEPPPTLLEYFPTDFLLFVDESHATIPQIGGMYRGDRSRKMTLVEHGFRLPSALDNRPLNFMEFEKMLNQTVYVSATPGPYERKKSQNFIVEQIIRPTGLMDPEVIVKKARGAVDDLFGEIKKRIKRKERVLVTTLTKRMAEDLTEFYEKLGLNVEYLHSDINTLERVEILRALRSGKFDVLIGINMLREGLDIPECSLVAILDADKEGFLRSQTSLIQTMGRASRNVNGTVILYADKITDAISYAIKETDRRRKIQKEYNEKHGITPATIIKNIQSPMYSVENMDYYDVKISDEFSSYKISHKNVGKEIKKLEKMMKQAAKNLEFEKAAELRDKIIELKNSELELKNL